MSADLPWPLPPMLAELARELPRGDLFYEPKWDGFRCLARRDGDEIDLRSRHGNPLGRYFPEIVDALATLPESSFVLDGEIVAERDDFPALMARLHPAASRVERLRAETPAVLVAFDLLAVAGEPLLDRPFDQRRERLDRLVALPVILTPATEDPDEAAHWLDEHEGVIAKRRDLRYEPGKRRMVKVKRDRTADCVVAGFRWHVDRPVPSSLLLGLYDAEDTLQHVGIAASFARPFAEQLLEELRPRVVPLEGHPWEHGFLLGGGHTGRLRGAAGRWTPDLPMDWVPVSPELVAEVAFDQVDAWRFRHPGRFRRWRPDREPMSCRIDQLAGAAAVRP